MDKKAVVGRIFLLVIVVVLMWFLLANKIDESVFEIENEPETNLTKQTTYKEISSGNKSVSQAKDIVTDRYIVDLSEDGSLIIKTNGKYYEIKEGNLILDSKVVTVSEKEKEVQFLESPRRTISSN